MISIVIPTLNEAAVLEGTLEAIATMASDVEVVCVDGGSIDHTCLIAETRGARVMTSGRGRGTQMAAGAAATTGDVLWFLHADTRPPPAAIAQMQTALVDARVVGGNFGLVFEGRSAGARFLNQLYPRLAWLGLRYGDSGLWVRRATYLRAGGMRPLPLFEDLDLLRRVRRFGRLATLPGPLRTSSRRFEDRPFAPVFMRWVWLQLLYWVGCDAQRLGRMYYPAIDHRDSRRRKGVG